MTHFDYNAENTIKLLIREDIVKANRVAWGFIGRTGSWWKGFERIAIAEEVRHAVNCDFCQRRQLALSPYSMVGEHRSQGILPDMIVDAIHRIVTDSGRITEKWIDTLDQAGFSRGHYVELLSIVVMVFNVDTFHFALGLPLEPLPKADTRPPTGYVPSGLMNGQSWVPMLSKKSAGVAERDLYADVPKATNVLRALSCIPDAVRCQRYMENRYYLEPKYVLRASSNGGRALSRAQIEWIASRVSLQNACFYCSSSHSMLLQINGEITGEKISVNQLADGLSTATKNSFVQEATLQTAKQEHAPALPDADLLTEYVDAVLLRKDGLPDMREKMNRTLGPKALVDAAALIASFQRMNRIANATGVRLDSEVNLMSQEVQSNLNLTQLSSAHTTHTPSSLGASLLGRFRPLLFKMLNRAGD